MSHVLLASVLIVLSCAPRSLLWDDSYNGTFKAEFAKEFEPPYDVEETIRWMEAYLNRVEHMVQTLEDVFDM